MEKISLTLSSSYVSHWTVYDALRELYQNVFDRANEDDSAEYFTSSTASDGKVMLVMGNYNTTLERKTLILGETSKKDSKTAIGQFGEGYKLAMIVLLRNGIDMSIITGGETWIPKLEYNKQFGSSMLTIHVEANDEPTNTLSFVIDNIPKKTWSSYSQYNLKLQENFNSIQTDECEVLTDKRNKGKVFVGGLYVARYEGTSLYGYNFNPAKFKLGRDRNIVSGMSTNWEASKALVQASIEHVDVLNNIVANMESDDISYARNFSHSATALVGALWTKFSEKYPLTIPVGDGYDLKRMQKQYVNGYFVVVTSKECDILEQSNEYRELLDSFEEREDAPAPTVVVNLFYDNHVDDMSDNLKKLYAEEIMTAAINWRVVS